MEVGPWSSSTNCLRSFAGPNPASRLASSSPPATPRGGQGRGTSPGPRLRK